MEYLDVIMADLPQFVTFLKNHRSFVRRSPAIGDMYYSDFSFTASESINHARIVPPEYRTTPSLGALEDLVKYLDLLKHVIREGPEVRGATWEMDVTLAGILLGTYALR